MEISPVGGLACRTVQESLHKNPLPNAVPAGQVLVASVRTSACNLSNLLLLYNCFINLYVFLISLTIGAAIQGDAQFTN